MVPDSGVVSNPNPVSPVTINGNNFLDASNSILVSGVSFGGVAVTGAIELNNPSAAINIVSATVLEVAPGSVPPGAALGPVDVTISGATVTDPSTGGVPVKTASATFAKGFYYGGALYPPVASLVGNSATGATGAQAIAVDSEYTAIVTQGTGAGQLAVFGTGAVRGGGATPTTFTTNMTTNSTTLGASDLAAPIDVRIGAFGSISSGAADTDIAVLSADGSVTVFVLSSATGPLNYTVTTLAAPFAATANYAFDVGDINGDGFFDIVVVNDQDQIGVFLNNGQAAPGTFAAALTQSSSLTSLGFGTARQHVKIAGGTGIPTCGCACNSTIPTDMDRDNIADLVITKDAVTTLPANSANVSVWLGIDSGAGTGTGAFANSSVLQIDPNNPNVETIALGDVDKNSTTDVIIGDDNAASPGVSSVTVISGDGFGGMSLYTINTVTGANPTGLVLGDVNYDCVLDITIAPYNNDQVAVLLGQGDGSFSPPVIYAAEVTNLTIAGVVYDPDTSAQIVSLGSFQGSNGMQGVFCLDQQQAGSGVGQALVTHLSRTNADVYFGLPQSGISFTTPSGPSGLTGIDPTAFAFGNVTGTGFMDFVVVNALSSVGSSAGIVEVFLGSGNETFSEVAQVTTLSTNASASSVTLVPLTASGQLDLVVACAGDDTIQCFMSQGGGNYLPASAQTTYSTSFNDGTVYVLGQTPVQVISTEIDGDGFCDIVTVNQVSNNVAIFLGTHDKNNPLQPATHITVGDDAPVALAAGALGTNSAGAGSRLIKMDLVTANSTNGSVTVLLNNSTTWDGNPAHAAAAVSFSSVIQYPLGGDINVPPPLPTATAAPVPSFVYRDPNAIQPHAIAIADLNLDGAPGHHYRGLGHGNDHDPLRQAERAGPCERDDGVQPRRYVRRAGHRSHPSPAVDDRFGAGGRDRDPEPLRSDVHAARPRRAGRRPGHLLGDGGERPCRRYRDADRHRQQRDRRWGYLRKRSQHDSHSIVPWRELCGPCGILRGRRLHDARRRSRHDPGPGRRSDSDGAILRADRLLRDRRQSGDCRQPAGHSQQLPRDSFGHRRVRHERRRLPGHRRGG